MEACSDWLLAEIDIVKPKIVFLMGSQISKFINGDDRFRVKPLKYVTTPSLWGLFNSGEKTRKQFIRLVKSKIL